MRSANKFLFKLFLMTPRCFKGMVRKFIVKQEGGQMYSMTLRAIFKKLYNIDIGYGSYGGCFSAKNIPSGVSFGNYCSIASEIRIFRANHPKSTFTSHPLLYNPIAGYAKEDLLDRPKLVIGHDVWIGEWATILPNVSEIGNGAMIGAGSVVTKNVTPYTIVAGNPARIIGYRFDTKVINEIERTEWWKLDKDELISNIERLQKIVNK